MINEISSILELAKKNITFYKILIWVFVFGLLSLLPHYYSKLKKSNEKWENMDISDKIVLIILLGIIVAIPTFFISLFFLGLIFITWIFINPYSSGKALDLFNIIFLAMGISYIAVNERINDEEMGWNLLRKTTKTSLIISFTSVILFLIVLIVVIIICIPKGCIVFK